MHLLVVEDDDSVGEPLERGLIREGFEVTRVSSGADALVADIPDLVLLDLGLPDLDGSVVCKEIRQRSAVPIIVVTARSEEIDRVMLLEMGADDYVVKPFGFRELTARIRAVLRRSHSAGRAIGNLVSGPLEIDVRARKVRHKGDVVQLAPKEFDLLLRLAQDCGTVITREQLLEDVWDEHWWGSTRTLDVHVAALRKKLDPALIETVRGVGFRLQDPQTNE